MIALRNRFKLSSRQYALLGALFFFEVLFTAWLFITLKSKEREIHEQILKSEAAEINASVQKEITVNLEKLRSLNALFAVAYPVSRENFWRFTGHLIDSKSSIQALEWIPRIKGTERDSIERKSAGFGPSEFRITENHGNRLYPASIRNEYYPVYYIEPYHGNEKALGFDLSSNPVRMQAMLKSERLNSMVISDPIDLVQENFTTKGVLAFLPFKKDGELIGFFTGVLDLKALVNHAAGGSVANGFNVSILDSSSAICNRTICDFKLVESDNKTTDPTKKKPGTLHYSGKIMVADREWSLVITPDETQISLQSSAHLIVLILCIAISIALCNHLYQHFISENLLLNILPAEVAKELKKRGKIEAREYESVSILFTDFTGFTEASSKMSAHELVEEINTCFSAFDNIISGYGLEKIKTIGDAYMAAGGLPVPDGEAVKYTVMAALDMQQYICRRKVEKTTDGKIAFEMRIGIETGPIVAGVVGSKKFQYDIWGDTVNTASRLETLGEIGKVNISRRTYEIIKDNMEFSFDRRGEVPVKGKGEMEMWYVVRK